MCPQAGAAQGLMHITMGAPINSTYMQYLSHETTMSPYTDDMTRGAWQPEPNEVRA